MTEKRPEVHENSFIYEIYCLKSPHDGSIALFFSNFTTDVFHQVKKTSHYTYCRAAPAQRMQKDLPDGI